MKHYLVGNCSQSSDSFYWVGKIGALESRGSFPFWPQNGGKPGSENASSAFEGYNKTEVPNTELIYAD